MLPDPWQPPNDQEKQLIPSNEDHSFDNGMIALIVIIVVALLAVAGFFIFRCIKKRSNDKSWQNRDDTVL